MKPLSGSALPLLRAFSGVERVNERRDVEQGHKFRRRRPHPLMLLPPSLDFKVWDPRKRETGKSFPFGDMIGVSFYSFWRQFTHCGRLQRVVYLFRTRERANSLLNFNLALKLTQPARPPTSLALFIPEPHLANGMAYIVALPPSAQIRPVTVQPACKVHGCKVFLDVRSSRL